MTEVVQIVIGGLLQGSIFAILALGFSLVYRVTGVVNLSQGAFCIVAAMTMYSLEMQFGWPALAAGLAAILATALFALLIGAATFVPALARLPNSGMLMVTVGILTLVEGLVLAIWGSQPYALPPFSGERPVSIAGFRIASQGFWVAGATVAIIVALWYLLARTTLGKTLRACAENMDAARLMGISVPRATLFSFVLAATTAGIGGLAVAPITSLEFDTGRLFTISGFIAVAIGGIGSFAGAIAGGLFLGVVSQLAAAYVSSLFANALALIILLAVLLVRPNGLFAPRAVRRHDVREGLRVSLNRVRLKGMLPWALASAAVIFVLALPLYVPPGGLLSSLIITGILFIAVLGLDVLMGYAGQVNLGQAGFMAIGGYTAAILATRYDVPPLPATLWGVVLSVLAALVLALVTMRLRGLYLALATLAFGLLVDSLTVGLMDLTGGPSGLVGIPSFAIGPYAFDTPLSMYYLVAFLIIVLVFVLQGGMRSSFGRALQAIRTDPLAAAALGINVGRYKVAAMAISAALASLSGSLYAFYFHFLSPEMVGTQRSFEMLTMLVVGGEATLVGPIIGVALLTLLPTIFQPLAIYKTFASGALLIAFFLYMPQGIYGALISLLARLGGAREQRAPVATPLERQTE
jgi:branched-chain amino acid transport system permease protein